jgi:hypothetical protein
MLESILAGEEPTTVFRRLIEADSSIGNIVLGEAFSTEFPRLTGEAEQLIWHWKGPGKQQGLGDSDLNAHLVRLLKEAGYL